MSEENKDEYEVGIPLDELPPEESSSLPDLFDTEELEAAGLTAELVDAFEDGAQDENSLFNDNEPSLTPENNLDIPGQTMTAAHLHADDETFAANHTRRGSDADKETFPEPIPIADAVENAPETDAAMPFAEEGDTRIQTLEMNPNSEAPVEDGLHDQNLLADRLASLSMQITELQREFEGKLKYDAHKDEVIDRLHAELQEYKQNILKKYVLSIVMDIVKVADDIRKWLTYFRSLEISQRDPRKLFRYLEAIPSDLEDVFYWHGVKPFSNQEGPFDPTRQRTIKKVPTSDPTLDKNVAYSIRPGYEWETKIVRQEMVAVYVHQEAGESTNTGMIDE